MHNADGVLSDQVIRLTGYQTSKKFPAVLRRVTYYAADKNKTFIYLTNNMETPATQVALLYKYRWHVELSRHIAWWLSLSMTSNCTGVPTKC